MEGLTISTYFAYYMQYTVVFSIKCIQRAFRIIFLDQKIFDKKITAML